MATVRSQSHSFADLLWPQCPHQVNQDEKIMQNTPAPKKRRQTNLETANAMFKNAFLVKKTRFAKENPGLSDSEVTKMTAQYFRNLPDDDGGRGFL